MKSLRTLPVRGSTLLEGLVAIAVMAILLAIILSVTSSVTKVVRASYSKMDAFQGAQAAFDIMARKLSQATLSTYWEYDDPATPTTYTRASDLHFLIAREGAGQAVYFQAPTSFSGQSYEAQDLLNSCAYFVRYGNDDTIRPVHVTGGVRRYRLFQAIQPTESLRVFTDPTSAWTNALHGLAWPIADNVLALIIWPQLSTAEDAQGSKLSPDFLYDSRAKGTAIQYAQLPPNLQLTLVVIDEASASRIESDSALRATVEAALANKFTDVTKYADDLKDLEEILTAKGINCRIFSRAVALRESKWSASP